MNKQIIFAVSAVVILIAAGAGVVLFMNNNSDSGNTITVTDGVGREVTVPSDVKRVACVGYGVLRYYSYVGDMEKLVGVESREKNSTAWSRPYTIANQDLFNSLTTDIGANGSASSTADREKLVLADLDVLFISSGLDKAGADELQEAIKTPVVRISTAESMPFDEQLYKSLRLIAKVVGTEERAEEVISYVKSIQDDFKERTSSIPEAERKTAYVGAMSESGAHGIDFSTAYYTLFEALNVNNAYAKYLKDSGKTDEKRLIHDISKEVIPLMDPDYIILDDGGLSIVMDDYATNSSWYDTLKAFSNGNIAIQNNFNSYDGNLEIILANGYYLGKYFYPEQFKDVDFVDKYNEITTKLLGKPLYNTITPHFPYAYDAWNTHSYSITDDSPDHNVTILNVGNPGSVFKGKIVQFSVSGSPSSVKVNGETVTATQGIYSFKIMGDTTITVA